MRSKARPGSRADLAFAILTGGLVFAVYLATIYPGLTDIGDATKFAFVGKVLGTPHAPGYPLFVWTSHFFSYVPWGTLAFRMNVFSAIWGAVAVGLGYLIARRLGARPAIAVATALALGFGDAFWSRAEYAKGYTLNAAFVSAGMLALLVWDDTRRRRYLLLSVGIFAVGLGNHLTILALLPALVLFVLATDARVALRPSTIAATAALVAMGFSQYLLILVRTREQAPYLEAHARNLRELWGVMTARRFAPEIGAFSWGDLFGRRVPIISHLIGTELHAAGALFVLAGLVWLGIRQWRRTLLFGLGALGVAALTANMSSNEDQGFLLSVFVLVWPMAAVGLEWLASDRQLGRPLVHALVLVAAASLPIGECIANYRANDHHADTFETEYFDTLFDALPAKAAIVNDEYVLNMIVNYKLLGEHAQGERDIVLARADPDNLRALKANGFEVFAFDQGRGQLAERGFHFVPYALTVPPGRTALMRRRSVFRLLSTSVCRSVANAGWKDLSSMLAPNGRLSVRIDDYAPFESTTVVYAGTSAPDSPAVVGAGGVGKPVVSVEMYAGRDAAARARLLARADRDRVTLPASILDAPFVARVEVRVNDRGQFSVFGIDVGGAAAAIGQVIVDQNKPERGVVCSHPLAAVDGWRRGEAEFVIPPDTGTVEFSSGWYPVEHRSDGMPFRWTESHAVLVTPMEMGRDTLVEVEAEPLGYRARRPSPMTLEVNGRPIGARPMNGGRETLQWTVPAEDWRAGLNEIALDIEAKRPSDVGLSADHRLLGASVSRIRLTAAPRARNR